MKTVNGKDVKNLGRLLKRGGHMDEKDFDASELRSLMSKNLAKKCDKTGKVKMLGGMTNNGKLVNRYDAGAEKRLNGKNESTSAKLNLLLEMLDEASKGNSPVGRKVKCGWHDIDAGEIVKVEPHTAAMTDTLVRIKKSKRRKPGSEVWVAMHMLKPIDGKGPLPSRKDLQRESLGESDDGPPKGISDVAKAYTAALRADNDKTRVTVFYWGKVNGWVAKTQWPRYPIFILTDDGKWYAKNGVKGRKTPLKGDPVEAAKDYLE